jgi:hypothetical protein
MKQKQTGGLGARYNSRTDKDPPKAFQGIAKSIGVPLGKLTLDGRGRVLKREHFTDQTVGEENEVTLPLPEKDVAVGATWAIPTEIEVPLEGGGIKRVKLRRVFTFREVKDGIATIGVESQILSPIESAAIEARLIQRESAGSIRFDIASGRVISQSLGTDRRVLGFRGATSSLHSVVEFTEKLLPEQESPKSARLNAAQAK